jgi:hypothetical protein
MNYDTTRRARAVETVRALCAERFEEIRTCVDPRQKLELITQARRANFRAVAELHDEDQRSPVRDSAIRSAFEKGVRVWLLAMAREEATALDTWGREMTGEVRALEHEAQLVRTTDGRAALLQRARARVIEWQDMIEANASRLALLGDPVAPELLEAVRSGIQARLVPLNGTSTHERQERT